ncbi:MAG: antibiotic biosynthesis monooxygenase [Deltaproteobacteria bacterium]|nr:antibiotic biosynthesis monooxygenase [Deltaproteobacteria bacterium]
METIDLKSREIFGDEGRGIAVLVDEPTLKIRQIGLEPGKHVPLHQADAPVTIQVVRGEGVFSADGKSLRMGTGTLLRIPLGASMGIANTSEDVLVFLVIKTPLPKAPPREAALGGKVGSFVNLIDFAPPKPGKLEAFLEWFRRSNEVFARHPGFLSRTLLGPIEGGSRYAAVVEHESKETFMDMQLSDDREELFHQVEPLLLGTSKPLFYELLGSFRKSQ